MIDRWPVGRGHVACACGDCGLLFVHPPPSNETLQRYYAPGGRWSVNHGDTTPPTKTGGARALLAAFDGFFPASRPAHGSSVLDFGCGSGALLDEFQRCGWTTYGIEPSTDLAFDRHQRLLSLPAESQFDLVVAYHVLEHLSHPLETLRQLSGAIRQGGHCFVSVPRVDTLATHGKVRYCLRKNSHIVAFTEACLRGLLARAELATLAAFHDLDRSRKPPLRLRLLAAKVPVLDHEPDVGPSLQRVIEALDSLVPTNDTVNL